MRKTIRPLTLFLFLAALHLAGFGGRALAAFPATIDSDAYVYATSPQFRTYFCAAGRLQLHLAPGSTTRYVGTFLDYVGLRPRPAFANVTNATNPVIAIFTTNGLFAFQGDAYFGSGFYSGTSTVVPPAFRKYTTGTNKLYFSATTHASNVASFNFILSERIGPPAVPDFEYTGTITIQYDANNRVSGGTTMDTDSHGRVHYGKLVSSGYYSSSYLYLHATINGIPLGISGTFSGASWSGYAFSGIGANARSWVISGTPTP